MKAPVSFERVESFLGPRKATLPMWWDGAKCSESLLCDCGSEAGST